MKKLLAVGALALACLVVTSAIVTAAPLDVSTEPILTFEDITYPAVCEVAGDATLDAVVTAMVACVDPATASKTRHSFELATLRAPASIYELPIYVRIDPGRLAGAVT